MAHSPFAEAFVAGTRFRRDEDGLVEIITKVVGELKVPTGRIGVGDPLTGGLDEAPLATAAPTGVFPVELAIARLPNGDQRVACARVRFGANDVAVRWAPALFEGQVAPPDGMVAGYGVDAGTGCFFDAAARAEVTEEVSDAWLAALERNDVPTWSSHVADHGEANVAMFSSGWGDGFYSSYWGYDAGARLVELVTDFEVLIEPISLRVELPLPLPRGRVRHPILEAHDVTLASPLFSRTTAIVGGKGTARVTLSDGAPVNVTFKGDERHYTWERAAPETRLVVSVMTGVRPLEVC